VKKEETLESLLDFRKLKKIGQLECEVLPCIVQDVKSGEVINLAYVNEEALLYTLKEKVAAFWSTSRDELWIKGKTSGDFLDIVEVRVNCEQNSLLYLVNVRTGASCHTGRFGCYYRKMSSDTKLEFTENSDKKAEA
jgi:phosphoribosyl-AMP cyclohydrolase